ncbi:aspartate ammonia-lyase [Streptomyces albus]|uniref:Aspartate ammonia-lyase n=1 Tax=Streptomyces albus (strain ATCC 21838 / DSM 41398 / FERM P-419 / JCM 4703 / NBRC 107858) TaxID=1081613 RepID=A0A0B5EGK6_STRA4|nr:aspartate ammonia-lyase [Streptomyces albus]AOU74779.1 aspartate ammonia-lyase [Streptomyces albus]AYN30590.1 aspartate ammonia-lyase [Streptomyces albus]
MADEASGYAPKGLLFGEQTSRALANFDLYGTRLSEHPELIRALALVKVAAARVNRSLGALDPVLAEVVAAAAFEVAEGRHDDQFPLPVVQGGGGTSTHMNVNEVVARRATQLLHERGQEGAVHPNNHVNRGQSTNDVMPTALALAVHASCEETLRGLDHLAAALHAKAEEYPSLEHLGRTCLQDAVALPVSAVHRSHAHGIEQAVLGLRAAVQALLRVPLGGTAVGTGVGAPPGFAELAVAELAELTGVPVLAAENPYWGMASLEPLVAVSEAIDRCARSAARVASDLRLLASGPVGGIGEVRLPAVQAGSSIMPGKVNPVMPELMMQISFQIAGEAASARLAAGAGEMEVSAMAPVVTLGVLAGLKRLGAGARLFADRCVAGLSWNTSAVHANLAGSLTQDVIDAAAEGYDGIAHRRKQVMSGSPAEDPSP